jgi:hypothetical protein
MKIHFSYRRLPKKRGGWPYELETAVWISWPVSLGQPPWVQLSEPYVGLQDWRRVSGRHALEYLWRERIVCFYPTQLCGGKNGNPEQRSVYWWSCQRQEEREQLIVALHRLFGRAREAMQAWWCGEAAPLRGDPVPVTVDWDLGLPKPRPRQYEII